MPSMILFRLWLKLNYQADVTNLTFLQIFKKQGEFFYKETILFATLRNSFKIILISMEISNMFYISCKIYLEMCTSLQFLIRSGPYGIWNSKYSIWNIEQCTKCTPLVHYLVCEIWDYTLYANILIFLCYGHSQWIGI